MDQRLRVLWLDWTLDPLRSIGILLPPASLCLSIRVWWGRDWRVTDGSWWGLALVAIFLLITWLAKRFQIAIVPPVGGEIPLFQTGLLLWIFVSGVTVLFGGLEAWRLAAFPLALLLFVNPVPSFFSNAIDMPLQQFAARMAKELAATLGMSLSGSRIQLMFAPNLGMFIAPGCNGLRGAVAMSYLALIVGYLHGMSKTRHILYVIGAVLLAYGFNLVRLCSLIVCYWLAIRVPPLAAHMVALDYMIGAVLFFSAAVFLFQVPHLTSERFKV
jgi:exosortase J